MLAQDRAGNIYLQIANPTRSKNKYHSLVILTLIKNCPLYPMATNIKDEAIHTNYLMASGILSFERNNKLNTNTLSLSGRKVK